MSPPSVVPQTPTLTASSRDPVLLTSTKLTLTCKSGSTDTITYKFQLNGHDISKSGPGATYTVPQTVSASANKYTCVALHGSARSAASQQISVRFVGELYAEHSGKMTFFKDNSAIPFSDGFVVCLNDLMCLIVCFEVNSILLYVLFCLLFIFKLFIATNLSALYFFFQFCMTYHANT